MGRANLRKKEKTKGLVGAKNRGQGGPTYGKRETKWISRGLKQGAGRANIRKKEKSNALVGLKTNRGGQTKENRKKE